MPLLVDKFCLHSNYNMFALTKQYLLSISTPSPNCPKSLVNSWGSVVLFVYLRRVFSLLQLALDFRKSVFIHAEM